LKKRTFADIVDDGSKEPPRRKIAGTFLYEDTNTFFFSRTNMGKSILAFQIAYAAATGTSIDPCSALLNQCEPMKTLVLDLEMDAKTLFDRHGQAVLKTDHRLLDNLIYLHEKTDKKVLIGFELLEKIEKEATDNQAKLIIIDNISKLLPDSLKAETVTMVISKLKLIREKTGAFFLVIGHTTKGDVKTCISGSSYYGSAMLQNFFQEIFYLDATKDNRFFLCHAKTKQKECYTETVPVFTRDEHPVVGLGFTFQQLMPLSEVQLPMMIVPERSQKKIKLSDFRHEIAILDQNNVRRARIAEMLQVNRSAITHLFEPDPF
jgi:hypothetical protein